MENLRCPMVSGASSRLKIYTSGVRVHGQSWKSHLSATNDSFALHCFEAQQRRDGRGCVRIPISSFEASAVVSRLYRFIPTVHLPVRGGVRSRQSILHEANFFRFKKNAVSCMILDIFIDDPTAFQLMNDFTLPTLLPSGNRRRL